MSDTHTCYYYDDDVGVSRSYQLPYCEWVPTDPNIDQMKQCVCVNNRRPTIPDSWAESEVRHLTLFI